MFEHMFITEHISEDLCRLIDDRGKGNGIDDPLQAVRAGVVEGKPEGSQCLAATRGHGQREKACLVFCLGTYMGEDLASDLGKCTGAGRKCSHVRVKTCEKGVEQFGKRRPVSICLNVTKGNIMGFSIAAIGVNETGKQHAHQNGTGKAGDFGIAWETPDQFGHEAAEIDW